MDETTSSTTTRRRSSNKTARLSWWPLTPHIRVPIGRALSVVNYSSKALHLPFGLIRLLPAQIFTKLFQEVVSNSLTHTETAELALYNFITRGNTGAVDGVITLEDGKTYAFCDVYRFGSAKNIRIKEITSYLIKT